MANFKIAIIGAGPAGCTLARILLNHSIPVTVFEGEVSPNIRSQGGTLDLRSRTGLAAIKEAGLYPAFLKYARYDGESLAVTDKHLKRYINLGGRSEESLEKGARRPEIDRTRLREILFQSLPEDVIRWGCRLRKVDEDLGLHFDHGVETGFDLIIGADGAWSKVRPVLSSDKPFHAGVSGVGLEVSDFAERFPDLDGLVNRGSVFAFSDGKSVTAQQMGDGSLHISTWQVGVEDLVKSCGYDVHDVPALKTRLLKEFEGWAPELRKMIEVADDEAVVRPLYMLPVGNRWTSRAGVTLMGDAAHLMTPFAGEGANLAMEDAMKLASAIVSANRVGTTEALAREVVSYEENMFQRAKALQEITKGNLDDMFFEKDAPRAGIQRYVTRALRSQLFEMNGIADKLLTPLIGASVYVFYFFFKLLY